MLLSAHDFAVRAGGRTGVRRLVAAAILAGAATLAAAPAGDQAVTVDETGGLYTVRATFTAPEPPAIAMAVLTDYADIPRFMPEVRRSRVIERGDGHALVEQEAVAGFLIFSKRIHLLLDVRQEAGTIRFRDRCGRSFARYDGSWTVAEQDGRTRVAYELFARPAFDVPGFLLKRLLKRNASQTIERLQAEFAARSGSGARAPRP